MAHQLGYEFAKFKLKNEADREALKKVSRDLDQYFFPTQDGFLSHKLVELDGGEFMDLVTTKTRADAERICGNWNGNAYCEAFLALIDEATVSIGFGEDVDISEER